jgi:transposase InsO family protein
MIAAHLRRWIRDVGSDTLYIQPGSPWENGYCESFNGKLGYVIFDPASGDGVYKITGGADGSFMKLVSFLEFVSVFTLCLVASVVAALAFAGPLAWLIIGWELLSLTSFVVSLLNGSINTNKQFQTAVIVDWVLEALGLTPFGAGGAGAVAAQWFGGIISWMLTNPFGWFY